MLSPLTLQQFRSISAIFRGNSLSVLSAPRLALRLAGMLALLLAVTYGCSSSNVHGVVMDGPTVAARNQAAANSGEPVASVCARLLPKCKPDKPKPECECSLQTVVDLYAARADTPDGIPLWHALQELVQTSKAAQWVTVESPQVSEEEEPRGPTVSQQALQDELKRNQATSWKFLTPKDYTFKYILHNPTRNQVVAEVELAGGDRLSQLLLPGQNLTLSHTAQCQPHGGVRTQNIGLILEFHFDCDGEASAKVVGIQPVRRELGVDKRACDADVPLEAIGRVWQALPTTRMTDIYLHAIDGELGLRTHKVDGIAPRMTVFARGKDVDVVIAVKNSGSRDGTVVAQVAPGAEVAIDVAAGGTAEAKLTVPANPAPVLMIRGILPRIRSTAWLVGSWQFREARIAILPDGKDSKNDTLRAYLFVPGSTPFVMTVPVRVVDGKIEIRATVPPALAQAVIPSVRASGFVDLVLTGNLKQMDQYVFGGGRAMPLQADIRDGSTADAPSLGRGSLVWSANQ